MKKTKVAFWLLLLSINIKAQNYSGRIINTFNEPVEGVEVSLVNHPQSTTTDSNGRFSFESVNLKQNRMTRSSAVIQFSTGILTLSLYTKENVNLNLYNLEGRLIRGLINRVSSPGKITIPLFIPEDSPGLYFIFGAASQTPLNLMVLNSGTEAFTGKFSDPLPVLQKKSATSYAIVCTKSGYAELQADLESGNKGFGELVMLKTAEALVPGIKFIKAYDSVVIARILPPDDGSLSLLELKAYQDYSTDSTYPLIGNGPLTSVSHIRFLRFDGRRDRMFSKFQLINTASKASVGAIHYVTEMDLSTARTYPLIRPATKKGISNFGTYEIADVLSLGARHTHYNVLQSDIIDVGNGNPANTIDIDGVNVPVAEVSYRPDSFIKGFTDNGINTIFVLLNGTQGAAGTAMMHPKTIPSQSTMHLGAFNTTSDEGIRLFRGYVEFLADHYTREDSVHGRITCMVIGNELTTHGAWYNMGRVSREEFIKDYHRTLRIADLACRKYHKDLRAFISLENHWNSYYEDDSTRAIKGNHLIEGLNNLSKSGGDFPWHIGYHPYPQVLTIPTYWLDGPPNHSFSTPYITFKNLEVLPVYMAQEQMLYNGIPRKIDITEVGFVTPPEPDGEKIQAAAYACSMYKVLHMDDIGMYIYHRHTSSTGEGLDFGLWTWDRPARKKLIWEVYRDAGEIEWTEDSFSFAKPILGISSWDECLPSDNIDPH
ncbi:MAG: carboxypeptidase regulatory-like domain-containing protein [Fibrobacteria bacterium]|nr:carboxypeptidase regulatory-like domain-containing protein [Fibrobacteria bacterium]